MDEQELKKKLALRAGFTFHPNWEKPWKAPNGSKGINPPNFPHSLDACLKHLEPKLDFWMASKEKTCRVGVVVQYKGKQSGVVFGETFALAFCLATERVID